MPASLNSLTTQQKRTLAFLIGFVLALAAAGGLMYDLSSKRSQLRRLNQEVERKEKEAQNLKVPSQEEQAEWDEQEKRVAEILITDESMPQFFEEITKIAYENGVQRLGINSEQAVIDDNPRPDETSAAGVGVRRYLVVTLKFEGDYADVARFIGGVSKLPRPLEFRVLDIRRSPPRVEVMVVLNVYKREAA